MSTNAEITNDMDETKNPEVPDAVADNAIVDDAKAPDDDVAGGMAPPLDENTTDTNPTMTTVPTDDAATATAAALAGAEVVPQQQQQQQPEGLGASGMASIGPPLVGLPTVMLPVEEEYIVLPGRENKGRWSKMEHQMFIQGMQKYGKIWKKVAGVVKTRTVMQTRTHAQKYFEKLEQVAKTGSPNLPPKPANPRYKLPDSKSATAASSTSAAAITAAAAATPGVSVQFKDSDVFLPVTEATASRPANKEYLELIQMNCCLFHSLPSADQLWFARNICHFMVAVRGRRWIGCHHFGYNPTYQILQEPVNILATEFRMDAVKIAALKFHPFWILGEHSESVYVHRTLDGSWKEVTIEQVKEILTGEGPKNLLLLPPSIKLAKSDEAIKEEKAEEEKAANATTTDGAEKKEDTTADDVDAEVTATIEEATAAAVAAVAESHNDAVAATTATAETSPEADELAPEADEPNIKEEEEEPDAEANVVKEEEEKEEEAEEAQEEEEEPAKKKTKRKSPNKKKTLPKRPPATGRSTRSAATAPSPSRKSKRIRK